ncbi:MAG: hypothetical protein HRU38_17760 [Saccharospirillaceae bacterium]|nr:hypothetical protein [Pseudomonadales bacterium]NRB80485.1 hypothetical protein [Saccharospirillaceae bacterium]
MFGNLFKRIKSQSGSVNGANYCFSSLRSVYGNYSGDAAYVKPVPIEGFIEKELNLEKQWPLLDVTSINVRENNSGGTLDVFNPQVVEKLEVTHKRLELMFRAFSSKLSNKNYDEYEKHTHLMVERCGILFQHKKFVFNSVFGMLDRATAFNEQSYQDFVGAFLKINPQGFRAKFGELVTAEFKAYTAIKKLLSNKSYHKAVKFLLAKHQRNLDKLYDEDKMGEILVRNFHQNEGAGPLNDIQQDELLRLESRLEKIANGYFQAWKNQLNFIYEWYPVLSAVTIISDAPNKSAKLRAQEEALI